MKKTHDLTATVGEYTDKETGEKKKRRVHCGVVLEDDHGNPVIKIESLPVANWSGFLSMWPAQEKRGPF